MIDVAIKKKYSDFCLNTAFATTKRRIGILGASGCGKSLTLRSIAGLIDPDDGFISIDDEVLYDHGKKINIKAQKRNTGYLFQEYALFPNMTVKGNIEAALHAVTKSRRANAPGADADAILRKFELYDVRDHRPEELSGGQKQRCALARMLAKDPKVLLLDEPFSAMDAFLREGMRLELIRILDEYDRTVIMVSHDRDELYQMCDHLVLMDNGRVITQGDTQTVFRDPGTPKAARLTGCKNISRIARLQDHKIKALDWNDIELVTEDVITDDITHVGIRAHDLTAGEHGVNVISCGRAAVSRLPFEWYVTLENGLWWKLPKELGDECSAGMVPSHISVPPGKIIPLRSDT